MPARAQRPCSHPGCPVLVPSGRCPDHVKQVRRAVDERRGSARARGYTAEWSRESKAFLKSHPLCQCPDCADGQKRVTPAVLVDHRIPHKGNKVLFWDRANWQAMAKSCHDRKTATEDGGFGRSRAP